MVAPPEFVGEPGFDENPGQGENPLAATPVLVGGPRVDVATEQAAAFVFNGLAGQSIAIRSNRPWSLYDPLGQEISAGRTAAIGLTDTGRYLAVLQPGLTPPASVQVVVLDPAAIVTSGAVGQVVHFNLTELRQQYVRIPLRGGQRYRLAVPSGERSSVCLSEADGRPGSQSFCVVSSGSAPADTARSFVLSRDTDILLEASSNDPFSTDPPLSVDAIVEEMANDVLITPSPSPVVDNAPKDGQSIVVPFWGDPSERAVLSSPNSAMVSAWGQPWIDREEGADGRTKVYAVPFTFDPAQPPFVTWSGSGDPEKPNRQRVGVYRGEDVAANLPTNGEPVTLRNVPWFASIGSMNFEAGGRYVVQVVGRNIRPLSLAVRDPSGKFTSSLSPWQWSEADGEQRALTTVSANRPGKWALEMRLAGNNVRDLKVSVLKAGGGGSYEGVVDVDDVLTVGESTDVQLGPNEFARLSVKMRSASPQIVQPDVQRYRNKTFQPTAVDMSLWDSRGRLVWSNNRNLEEEVLSGRLGQEPQLSEKYATVADIEPYTLIIDPHTDLAGRFRISVASTPVTSDVGIGNGTIAVLEGGTKTGVIEVRQATRYRLTGVSACLSSTSLREWSLGGVTPVQPVASTQPVGTAKSAVAPQPVPGRCLQSGQSIVLPIGVHRFAFTQPITGSASFLPVLAGSPADAVETVSASIDGPSVTLSRGADEGIVTFTTDRPSLRLVVESSAGPLSGRLILPDGTKTLVSGAFLATLPGTYSLYLARDPQGSRLVYLRSAVSEIQPTTLSIGAKNRIFTMKWGQRLEATVVLSARTRVGLDEFASPPGSISLVLVADDKERRYVDGGDLVLPAGRYRFVFIGSGNVRIALKRLPLGR